MQEHLHTHPTQAAPRFRERRDIVAHGVSAGQTNVVRGVEYLQSRGIETDIIKRVLLQLLKAG